MFVSILLLWGIGILSAQERDPSFPFHFVKTVTMIPDSSYENGAFCRLNYFPSKNKFYLTFGTGNYSGVPTQRPVGFVYKEYTADLRETGKSAFFHYNKGNAAGDAASVFGEGYYYFLTGGPRGFLVKKFDQDWNLLAQTDLVLDPRTERDNDQMLAYVNGQLDASSLFALSQDKRPSPEKGEATHHRLLDTNLNLMKRRVLQDTPHVNGSSMVFQNGIHHLVTSTAFFGDLIVIQYDKNWGYLGTKTLTEGGQWPQGTVYHDGVFYVSYLERGGASVILAAFDEDWNPVGQVWVTDLEPGYEAGRPSVIFHNGLLYVSYDVSTLDPETRETNRDWSCVVSIYRPEN